VEIDTIAPEHLLTSSEVACLLQVNASSIKKWVDNGHLHAFRTPGGHRRIRACDLITFLDEHEIPVPSSLRAAARRRVVIVDDDRVQLKALARRLRRASDAIDVEAIDDPLGALVRIGRVQPHAVIIDVLMPQLSGLELCRALRRSADTRNACVIAVSASMTEVLARDATAAGAHHALAKPLDPTFLLNEIGIAVESRR
jgi:excisionase family DNA binding protein